MKEKRKVSRQILKVFLKGKRELGCYLWRGLHSQRGFSVCCYGECCFYQAEKILTQQFLQKIQKKIGIQSSSAGTCLEQEKRCFPTAKQGMASHNLVSARAENGISKLSNLPQTAMKAQNLEVPGGEVTQVIFHDFIPFRYQICELSTT